jgi:hypothetical protein
MELKMLEKAVNLAKMTGYVFLATADSRGQPFIGSAREIDLLTEDRIGLRKWFCPVTINNALKNRRIALVIWDSHSDKGFQLFGKLKNIDDMAVMDGYAGREEATCHYPQVERQLIIEVMDIFSFKQAVRCDIEEESVCPPWR